MNTCHKGLKQQRGIATVEMALVTPFLLIMMLVSFEFSRVFMDFNTLTKSVRDAARYAADDAFDGAGNIDTGILANAKNLAVYGNINGAGDPVLVGFDIGDVTIVQLDQGTAPVVREHFQATATYTFRPLAPVLNGMGFLSQNFDMEFDLVARSTMRALQ